MFRSIKLYSLFRLMHKWISRQFGARIRVVPAQDEIARIRKRKRGRNMLNRSGNTTDNLCFRYRFRDVFSRFRCCVYNGTGPLFVHVKHNGNMELHVSATFQKYGNMWFRPVLFFGGVRRAGKTFCEKGVNAKFRAAYYHKFVIFSDFFFFRLAQRTSPKSKDCA